MAGKGVQQKYDIAEIVKMCEEKYKNTKLLKKNVILNLLRGYQTILGLIIRKKHNLWKRYMETKRVDTRGEYCKIRNKVKNMIKFFRKQKEREISMKAKTNNKAFWKYTNSKTKLMSSIASLQSDPLDEDSMLVGKNSEKVNLLY